MAVVTLRKLYVHKHYFNNYLNRPTNVTNVFSELCVKFRNYSVSSDNDEYIDFPEYPPILDLSKQAVKARDIEKIHNKIKAMQTIEEKLFAVNLPKYYGWKCLMFEEGKIPYQVLPLVQFITRTHMAEGTLPDTNEKSDLTSSFVNEIRPRIEQALVLEYGLRRRIPKVSLQDKDNDLTPAELENEIGSAVIHQVNRILLSRLSPEFPHLLEAEIDFSPRLEAFWSVGGIDPPASVRKWKENVPFMKDEANDPIDRWMQYLGSPVLQIRSEHPLPQNIPLQEYDDAELSVPVFKYDPRVLGMGTAHRHGTNIPGFWPGNDCQFGVISYHNMGHLVERPPHYGAKDRQESLLAQAILASYGWTLAQACYQGFSTFHDPTYPLVTQTVITNGQLWSFFSYQLNTTLLHSDHSMSNPRRNICWCTNELKLFESIDNGKVIGFNDDVLKMLVKLYTNTPKAREGVDMKPYLSKTEGPSIANLSDPERREWLEVQFKHMYSNRPRSRLPYEIYNWERIYKMDHKTRPLDKKRSAFEFGINPYKRKYSEHQPSYIPKKDRPDDKKNKNKWGKTYYPL